MTSRVRVPRLCEPCLRATDARTFARLTQPWHANKKLQMVCKTERKHIESVWLRHFINRQVFGAATWPTRR